MEFAEFEACIAAGLDVERWQNFSYPNELKAKVIAWHHLHNQIAVHSEDAVQRKMARKGK